MEQKRLVKPQVDFLGALEKMESVLDQIPITKGEVIKITDVLNRVLDEPLIAATVVPNTMLSGMDGIALGAFDDRLKNEVELLTLEEGEDFSFIDTGNIIPKAYDRVLMIERVASIMQDRVQIHARDWPKPFDNIRLIGEDIAMGEVILGAGRKITPDAMCLALSSGVMSVSVRKKPVCKIIPTGSEIIEVGKELAPGKIFDTNSFYIEKAIEEHGGIADRMPPVDDDLALISKALKEASKDSDFTVIVAGSSAGRRDFVHNAIERLGTLLFHGVSIKPGKPLMFGLIDKKPVIGMPGYPYSAFIWADVLVPIIVNRLLGACPPKRVPMEAKALTPYKRSRQVKEILRLGLAQTKDGLSFWPLETASSIMRPSVESNAAMFLEPQQKSLDKGDDAEVLLKGVYMQPVPKLLLVGSIDPHLELALSSISPKHGICMNKDVKGMEDIFMGGKAFLAASILSPPVQEDCQFEKFAFIPIFERPLGFWLAGKAVKLSLIADSFWTKLEGYLWAKLKKEADVEKILAVILERKNIHGLPYQVFYARPMSLMQAIRSRQADITFGGCWMNEPPKGSRFLKLYTDLYGVWFKKDMIGSSFKLEAIILELFGKITAERKLDFLKAGEKVLVLESESLKKEKIKREKVLIESL